MLRNHLKPVAGLFLAISIVAYQNCSADFVVAQLDSTSLGSSVITNSAKLRRLSNVEYGNALYDILYSQFSRRWGTPDTNQYWYPIKNGLSALPGDTALSSLGTNEIASNLSKARFDAYINMAYSAGKQIGTTSALLPKFAGACATSDTDVSNTTCLDTFINEFATLAFRTPPTDAERDELKKNLPNWHTLIARILMHPRFLLHFDRDGQKDAAGNYKMTDYEIEARLASVFWKSSPDVIGLNAVKSGALKTQAGLQAEIKRILDSQKARDTLWLFYSQWLATSRLPLGGGYDSGAGFEAFAAPLPLANLNNNLRNAVLTDGRQFLDYLTWTNPSKLEDIFRSPLIFTTDATLASIYGVSPRASVSDPPITDPNGRFKGILSRPMITQQKPSTNGDINHIQRGVFILTNLLNMELGQPANFADQQQASIVIPATASKRQEVVTKTSVGSCIGCHTTINPAGFALGNFDSLGRYITTEDRYNFSGTKVASNAVDASTSLALNGVSYSINDVSTLTDALFKSGRIYQGFANYYFQFTFGRLPSSQADKKILDILISNLATKTVRGAFEALAQSPEFATVSMGQ